MKRVILSLLTFVPFVLHCQSTTLLRGEITGGSDEILLYVMSVYGHRWDAQNNKITVKDGKFEYLLSYDNPECYEIIFADEFQQGSFTPVMFFPDTTVIEFTIPMDREMRADMSTVKGGPSNRHINSLKKINTQHFRPQFVAIENELDIMDREQTMYSEEAVAMRIAMDTAAEAQLPDLYKEIERLSMTKMHLSEPARELSYRYDSLRSELSHKQYEYIIANPDISGFYYVDLGLSYPGPDVEVPLMAYETLRAKYPEYHLIPKIDEIISSLENIRPGADFIDFSAPDLNGEIHSLGNLIEGKIAVLDMWASWCGPCRQKSRNMKPIYEKYSGDAFTIVGVAREFKTTTALEKAIEKDGYTWTNLVELDDEGRLWAKYGLNDAAGGIFLIDRNGKIAIINPTSKEIEDYLKSNI